MSTTLTAVRTEGGLLPPDLLERIRSLDAELPGLRPEDYGLAPGERLNDAIVRSWTRLNGLWSTFADRLDRAPDSETTFESQTRKLWQVPLFDELGFGQLVSERAVTFDDHDHKEYPVSHRASGVAIHLIGARADLDRRTRPGVRPAHGMVQEFLNRSDHHLWAITTNGLRLRLLRDSSSLTRQAYCEFDLEAMFRGQEYSDFALCWLVCHATRFSGEPQSSCYLERWSNQARTDGTRALDQLRGGVETAITALGTGFLAEPTNGELRRRLETGELAVDDYHRQLLRLVYRLIFLLVAEARGLLQDHAADTAATDRYRRWYSLQRIVELARTRRSTDHGDLWESLRVTFNALAGPGQPALGLSGLGSYLWSHDAVADLGPAALGNRALLDAVHRLTTVYETTGRRGRPVPRTVDYRNLGAEELGSVYEALLELHPVIDGRNYSLGTAAGSERKTTGSYYTPTPLIRELLNSALDPVLDEATNAADPEAALLALKVADPAAGSGHFLIAAAHRIAHRLASVRSGEAEPSPEELRHALREVIANCIYGIDVNPMAVELCKVSLWMEATEPGKPLSFLDHHIVCGNSLLGATPKLLNAGVPDDAFKPLEGDDKTWVSTLKKRNKAERKYREQGAFDFGQGAAGDLTALADGLATLEALPDDTPDAIAEKEAAYAELITSEAAARARLAADAWCAAFVAPKTPDSPVLTDEVVRNCGRDPGKVPNDVHRLVAEMAEQYRFLHLHITFPDVFAVPDGPGASTNEVTGWAGGFSAVLGNPPWERVKLAEKEFFATRDPYIAAAPNASARKKLIAALIDENPSLHAEFLAASRQAAGESQLLRNSGRYPLGGRGDVNTYAVFAELMRTAVAPAGRMGVIVPTGIATDDTTKHFFADLVDKRSLVSLFDFENRRKVFPGIDSRMKFSLLTLSGVDRSVDEADFVFFALGVDDLDDPEKRFTLSPEDFELLNPNTRTCPVFRTRRDAEMTKAVYRRVPVLVREGDPNGNPWGVTFSAMFHMSNDSALFRTRAQLENDGWELQGNRFVRGSRKHLPLYEAKMIHHFDHRWATYDGDDVRDVALDEKKNPAFLALPRYWVPREEVDQRIPEGVALLGFRDITNSTNERTLISALIGPVGAGNNLPMIQSEADSLGQLSLSAALSSMAHDYVARRKVGGTHVNFFIANQLPVPSPEQLAHLRRYLRPCALELTYTAWDLRDLAADLGHHGPPFQWDEERRALLRAELDALMFRLYGIERDDVEYILDTFPIVKRKDEAAHGEYRTKRLILECYDAMAAAEAAGEEYQTVLDPPPADPSLCHAESTRPDWARSGVARRSTDVAGDNP
jgi:hypothetical protein